MPVKAPEALKSPQQIWKMFSVPRIASRPLHSRRHAPNRHDPVTPTQTSSGQSAPADDARWFADEVHLHDRALKSYLRTAFPAIRDVEDLAQESYLCVWKQRAIGPIRSARAFLFTIARHLALNVLRHERRSPLDHVEDLEFLNAQVRTPAVHEMLSQEERIQLLVEAVESLPPRCREVVVHRKLRALSQRETARLLGISEKGVENQLARGLERCRLFIDRRGARNFVRHGV